MTRKDDVFENTPQTTVDWVDGYLLVSREQLPQVTRTHAVYLILAVVLEDLLR